MNKNFCTLSSTIVRHLFPLRFLAFLLSRTPQLTIKLSRFRAHLDAIKSSGKRKVTNSASLFVMYRLGHVTCSSCQSRVYITTIEVPLFAVDIVAVRTILECLINGS